MMSQKEFNLSDTFILKVLISICTGMLVCRTKQLMLNKNCSIS